MHVPARFAHIAASSTFTTAEIHPAVVEGLGCTPRSGAFCGQALLLN
jgi:hypothetical protein